MLRLHLHAFCDHIELLIRSRVNDAQTFTLLTDPQSIMVIGLRFMTSKVMERVSVADWKMECEVSLIIEALKECYPLTTSDNLVSTYDKWYKLYKSMRKTITIDQYNIALTRKQFSGQLIATLADYGEIPIETRQHSSVSSCRCSPTSINPTRSMAPTNCSTTISRRPSRRMRPTRQHPPCRVC